MDRDISKKSAKDKSREQAKGRAPGGEYQPLPFGPETAMLALHSAIGNQGVRRLLQSDGAEPGMIQAKLTVSQRGDRYEQEADRIADQVLSASAHPEVSGAPQGIQRFAGRPTAQSDAIPASVDPVLANSGSPLEPALRENMEQRFGFDFSKVRVHSGVAAARSARSINANAYTAGHNIVFGAGRFSPETFEGRRLIAHELAHVCQQSQTIHQFGPVGITQADAPRIQRSPEEVSGLYEESSEAVKVAFDYIVFQGKKNVGQVIANLDVFELDELETLLELSLREDPTQSAKISEALKAISIKRALKDIRPFMGRKLKRVDDSPRAHLDRALTAVGTTVEEYVHQPIEKGLEFLRQEAINISQKIKKETFAEIRKLIEKNGGSKESAEKFIIPAEAVFDILIDLVLAWFSAGVGLYKGLNQAVNEGRKFFIEVGKLLLDTLESALGNPENLEQKLVAIGKALGNMIPGLRQLAKQWIENYKAASDEERVSMIGEMTGQIIAMIMTEMTGARAGKGIGKTTSKITDDAVESGGKAAAEILAEKARVLVPEGAPLRPLAAKDPPGAFSKPLKTGGKTTSKPPKTAPKQSGKVSKTKKQRSQAGEKAVSIDIAETTPKPKSKPAASADQSSPDVSGPAPPGNIQAARKLVERYPEKLASEGEAFEALVDIYRRSSHKNNPVARRSAAAELAVLNRYLKDPQVKKITPIRAKRGTKKKPGGSTDFEVEFADGTTEPLEVTSITSAPQGRRTQRPTAVSEGGLREDTQARLTTKESYKAAIARKAKKQDHWKKQLQVETGTNIEGAKGIIAIHAPHGGPKDLPMIQRAIDELSPEISPSVQTIEFSFGGTPSNAIRFERSGEKFVLATQ
jgi:hypothetical protein